MIRGWPAETTSLAIFYIYQQAFLFNEYCYAASGRRRDAKSHSAQ